MNRNLDYVNSTEKINKLIKKATVYFRNYQDAEDFVLYLIERKVQNATQSFKQAYIDFLRLSSGKKGSLFYNSRANYFNRKLLPLYEHLYGIQPIDPIKKKLGLAHLQRFKRIERAAFILHTLWGLTKREIAYLFDYSEHRIGQILKEVKEKIKTNNRQ